jgi:nitric oxide reductase large subunit
VRIGTATAVTEIVIGEIGEIRTVVATRTTNVVATMIVAAGMIGKSVETSVPG